jgi:hypothetical protein
MTENINMQKDWQIGRQAGPGLGRFSLGRGKGHSHRHRRRMHALARRRTRLLSEGRGILEDCKVVLIPMYLQRRSTCMAQTSPQSEPSI